MKGTTMKILISLFFIFIGHHEFLNAQRTLPRPPRSNGEYSLTSSELIHTIILPQVHHDSLRQDDSLQNRSGRAGIGIVQSLNICSIATYDTLFDGSRIGRIRIVSPGAIWQSFRFTNFYLSEGCEVYIYNDEKTYTRGAFTSRNNKPFGGLYISTTVGSSHIIEIYETAGAFGLSAMLIDRVYQGYYPISTFAFSLPKSKENSETILRKFGGSEIECNTNVNCNNDYWCVEKHAVCVIENADDQDLNICTGTLLNNSAEDFKPYILTAWHCLNRNIDCTISQVEENTDYMAFFLTGGVIIVIMEQRHRQMPMLGIKSFLLPLHVHCIAKQIWRCLKYARKTMGVNFKFRPQRSCIMPDGLEKQNYQYPVPLSITLPETL